MQLDIIPEVGDKFFIKEGEGFAFMNKSGGTGLSDWDFNEKYTGPKPHIEIVHVFYDDEVGYRTWAKAINQELIDYMDRVAPPNDKRIFVSQWDLELP